MNKPTIAAGIKLLALLFLLPLASALAKPAPYYYQIKVYHLKTQEQEDVVDAYLQNAYLPALHRTGITNVAVFKPLVRDTAEQLVYVFIPFKKADDIFKLDATLVADQQYQTAGQPYLNAVYNNPPYTRLETILLKAFSAMPQPQAPNLSTPKNERVYELRSYEGATENISLNKIGMFNDDEISIFTKLNFNAVFYGQVIAGSHMPNLMYLTTFNNKADRDKHWADFGAEYKKISTLPKYLNNVSKNVTLFMRPTAYSDI